MKGQAAAAQFNLQSIIDIGNQLIGIVPKLIGIVYFIALIILLVRMIRAARAGGQGMSTIDLAAVCIAFGLGMR
jgi:hypothetical protein